MKVVLFGASGTIGSRVLDELVRRGHSVTAVARHPEKVQSVNGVNAVQGDVTDPASVAAVARGADAAVSAYAPPHSDPASLLDAMRALVAGLEQAGVRRLIAVGGAGSLEVAPGIQLVDTPEFPAAWKGIAFAHRDTLPIFKASSLEWTYFSPAALIAPGVRTGKFRLGGTRLVANDRGESKISAEDYAIALVDELENPQNVRRQFTAAY
jgi:putative NADH-flavin reductase